MNVQKMKISEGGASGSAAAAEVEEEGPAEANDDEMDFSLSKKKKKKKAQVDLNDQEEAGKIFIHLSQSMSEFSTVTRVLHYKQFR